MQEEPYEDAVETFRKPGIWATEVSDLMPIVMSNILERSVIIYSSNPHSPVIRIDYEGYTTNTPLKYAYMDIREHEHYNYCM